LPDKKQQEKTAMLTPNVAAGTGSGCGCSLSGTSTGEKDLNAANGCCSAEAQKTCCAPEDKSSCCGTPAATPANKLPVAVIGGGPVGLAAAAHLIQKGETPLVFEAGDDVGGSIRAWGHVRMFSPWKYGIDQSARALLETTGWEAPNPEVYPTGQDLYDLYLKPLSELPQVAAHLRLSSRVVSVTRRGMDKMKNTGREEAPFQIIVRDSVSEAETVYYARAVIDASGTYHSPNPLGASGVPAAGERAAAERIVYHIPKILGEERARYAGKRIAVVGSGHSAFNALLELATLADEEPGTHVTWAVRRATLGSVFGGGENDALAARGELGRRVRALAEAGLLHLVTGFRAAQVERDADGRVILVGEEDEHLPPVDEVIVTTGFRPDLSILAELRLGLDPSVEAPTVLAPMIDPNLHSCGTVRPHGALELSHPEKDFFIAGMKSYGRAPTFLLLTGYEQIRSIVCLLTGDEEGAREVRLELPETGVCNSNRNVNGEASGEACCGATAAAKVSAQGCGSDDGSCGLPTPAAISTSETANSETGCGCGDTCSVSTPVTPTPKAVCCG
jgi:thioredoxin reductase